MATASNPRVASNAESSTEPPSACWCRTSKSCSVVQPRPVSTSRRMDVSFKSLRLGMERWALAAETGWDAALVGGAWFPAELQCMQEMQKCYGCSKCTICNACSLCNMCMQ